MSMKRSSLPRVLRSAGSPTTDIQSTGSCIRRSSTASASSTCCSASAGTHPSTSGAGAAEAARTDGVRMGYIYIGLTILLTVYGQLVLKWQVSLAGALPDDGGEKVWFLLRLLLNPWVLSGFAAAFLASMTWMAAMTKFQLSYAYPFMSLNFALVFLLSVVLFSEPLTLTRVSGLVLIMVC